MENLIPIMHEEQMVLTTRQLAEVYETEENNIRYNYKYHENRFTEGVHYFMLKGADLKDFKNYIGDSNVVDKRSPHLILWTERGASRHCKILDTDRAWEQFDNLEETYFRVKNYLQTKFSIPRTMSDALRLAADLSEEKERLEEAVRVLQPQATGYQLIIDADGTLSLNEFAKSMNWGRNRLSELLRKKDVFMKGTALPYQQYISSGYFKVKERMACDGNIYSYSLVTPKGVDYIVKKVQQWGLADELLKDGRKELALV